MGDGAQEEGTVGKEAQAVSVLGEHNIMAASPLSLMQLSSLEISGKEQFSAALAVPSKAPLKWR